MSQDQRCSNCQHWKRSYRLPLTDTDIAKPLHFGTCSHSLLSLGHNESWAGHEFSRKDGMWGANQINGAPPETGEEFGCIHFEKP